MTAESKIEWNLEADYLQSCNCDYGCPCEFEAPPTMGFCEGMGVWHITKGNLGNISLDGLCLGFAIHFPAAMHQGNGRGMFFVDERASEVQRDALLQIATGEHGGMPFEILPMLLTDVREPRFVPFQFDLNGQSSSVKIGDVGAITTEPIRNPVTGEPESVAVDHATGFIFKRAEVVSAADGYITLDDWQFSYPNKAGFVAHVTYSNH